MEGNMRKLLLMALLCLSYPAKAVSPEAILIVFGFDFLHNGIRTAVGSNGNKLVAFMKGSMVGMCEFSMKLAAVTTPSDEILPLIKITHDFCASIGDNIQFNRKTLERLSFDVGIGSIKFDNWKPFVSVNIPAMVTSGVYISQGFSVDWKNSLLHLAPVHTTKEIIDQVYVGQCSNNTILVDSSINNYRRKQVMGHEFIHLLSFNEWRWLEEILYTDKNKDVLEHFDFGQVAYPFLSKFPSRLFTGKISPDRKFLYIEVEAESFQRIYDLTH
jgi:hypothetical protein